MGIEDIRRIKSEAGMPKEKKLYRIPAKSAKRIQREALEKELHKPDEDSAKEKWFKDRRKEMSGFCQCGCGRRSSKDDDRYFRHSCAHVFPKSKFDSVKLHPLNSVERAFWGGCHSVMDDGSINGGLIWLIGKIYVKNLRH